MTVHTLIRTLSQTPAGRQQLHRWSGCPVTDWQAAFEGAGDYANARLATLSRETPYLPAGIRFGSHEWHQYHATASAAQDAALTAELNLA